MVVKARFSRLRQTEWWEYLVRFLFGGVVTLLAGLVASRYGPVIGGLFLAFPGIFPAGVTLVERHERKKKERSGMSGLRRGRAVAGAVAAGAALGSVGLAAFATVAWLLVPRLGAGLSLSAATAAWLAVGVLAWFARSRLR